MAASSSSSSSILPPFYNQTETQNTAKQTRTEDRRQRPAQKPACDVYGSNKTNKKNRTIYKLRQPWFVICANVRSKGQDWEKRPDAAKQ